MFFRTVFPALLLAARALAGPPLTTIQDVLYKADGTRFNGILTISWGGFEASDRTAIATQSSTIKVIDGNLRVRLVPNTTTEPAVYYSVVYNSDGRVQFTETWAVPPSTLPLRLRDVRIATPGIPPDTGGAGPIQESDVVGLIADLSARPVKSAAFAAGRVAFVNPLGALESVSGNAGDCVHVDGSSGTCGSIAPSFVDGDSPAGIVDGSNAAFTLTGTPDPPASLAVYRNGLLQKTGLDYDLNGRVVQFVTAATPQPGDTLLASYRLGSSGAAPQLYPAAEVLCSGTGATINSTSFASMGTCAIPAGTLSAGDRVEIRLDLEHQGAASGFTAQVRWGAATIFQRDCAAADVHVAARADAALHASGAQISSQSWGTALPFAAAVGSAPGGYAAGLTIAFDGKMAQPGGETLALRNFTVTRLP